MLIAVTLASVYLITWMHTRDYGVPAVNAHETAQFGETYMLIRTDDPVSYFPFMIQTGFSTVSYDLTLQESYREPVSRTYYLWIGRVIKIGEWHKPKSC